MNMYITIYKNVMLAGNVTSTGSNIGGLVGYIFAYNSYNSTLQHYNYEKVENSFATR